MKKRKHSCDKYWIILLCWIFSSLFISKTLNVQLHTTYIMFAFVLPYWLFVMATLVYERHYLLSYIREKYPSEYKRLKRAEFGIEGERSDYIDFFDIFSPEEDEEWEKLQLNFERYILFVKISFLSTACSSFFYLFFLVVD